MPRSSEMQSHKPNKQQIKQATQILETERVWDHLRDRYYQEWLKASPGEEWDNIRIKLDMITDLRELLRKFDNA